MHNYHVLVTEANHRHSEHEQAVANDKLTARAHASTLQEMRQMLARVRSLARVRLAIPAEPATRLSLGADRART